MMAQEQKFIDMCKEFIKQIDEIDRDTPWSQIEPQWWLDMMKIRRQVQQAISTQDNAQ